MRLFSRRGAGSPSRYDWFFPYYRDRALVWRWRQPYDMMLQA